LANGKTQVGPSPERGDSTTASRGASFVGNGPDASAERQEAAQRRADVVEQIGDAGDVGEDVVAVEPDERRQLAHHLQDLRGDDQQERIPATPEPAAEGGDRNDRVEVQAAEIGPEPGAPIEPVGVGDVGVERRPGEIDPHAHRAGGAAATAQRRRVTELVEAGGQHGHHEDREQQARACERVVRRRGQSLVPEHPVHDREETDRHRHDKQRVEEHREGRSDPPGRFGA
jgi:hypothetical protein